jgi:anti-sigma regulatory factor (Ser/Thr protein kinase)
VGTGLLGEGSHVAAFYDDDDQLNGIVTSYLVAAARDGDAVIVIATAEHLASFALAWATENIAVDEDRVHLLDADAVLGEFMRDGMPDPDAFASSVGRLVRDAGRRGRAVRAYGEGVAVLWERGNRRAALALEKLWNDLGTTTPVAMVCGYPCAAGASGEIGTADDLASVCHLHTHVSSSSTREFAAAPMELRAARHFVADTLGGWGLEDLVDDATLIVSELTTNVLAHANSPFTVTLLRAGDGVHISVTDESSDAAELTHPDPSEPTGRGLQVVNALASQWGQTALPTGKRVWALLGTDE